MPMEDERSYTVREFTMPMEEEGSCSNYLKGDAVQEIKKLAAALSRQTGEEESVTTSHLYQKLSIHLMIGNSALLLYRIPNLPENHIDGSE